MNLDMHHMLNPSHLAIALALAVSIAAPAQDQSPLLSPGELIDAVVANPDQRRQDDARLDRLLHDPSQQLKFKQAHDEDELKLDQLMRVMPDAFLYDYDGFNGDLVRLKFRPKPEYNPPTYEARVVHNLAGTILIDPRQKRLVNLSGKLISRVDFGYGFWGHIDQGGTVEIGRVEVGSMQWKTALINIQLSGRLVLFKTVSKQQYETRSDFRQVPSDLSLSDANALLASASFSRARF